MAGWPFSTMLDARPGSSLLRLKCREAVRQIGFSDWRRCDTGQAVAVSRLTRCTVPVPRPSSCDALLNSIKELQDQGITFEELPMAPCSLRFFRCRASFPVSRSTLGPSRSPAVPAKPSPRGSTGPLVPGQQFLLDTGTLCVLGRCSFASRETSPRGRHVIAGCAAPAVSRPAVWRRGELDPR